MPKPQTASKTATPPKAPAQPSALGLLGGVLSLMLFGMVVQRSLKIRTPKDWADPAPLPKEGQLGDYQLGPLLADGGTATVYLGRDSSGGPVAIKIPHRGPLRSRNFVSTFEREAQIGIDLRHPSIVRVLAAGHYKAAGHSRIPYFVMEFLEGQELEVLLEDGRFSERDAIGVARGVADALAWAHARGVVHRDISPRNIFVTNKRAVKVMDFGISTVGTRGNKGSKARGLAFGTPEYLAPERSYDAAAADERSDLYALGCVLYEMLAGHPPYLGDSAEAIIKGHIKSPIPSLAQQGLATVEVDAITQRLLAKNPKERFQTATEVAARLAELVPML